MDFSKPPRGMASPNFPAKHAAPRDDDIPAGADWFVWDLTIGPADGGGGHSSPNPMSPSQPDPMPSLLASTLNWTIPSDRK
jgi:hypothetical protein